MQQLAAHFPEVVVTEQAGFLVNRWHESRAGETVVVEFGLCREFILPLRVLRALDPDPLGASGQFKRPQLRSQLSASALSYPPMGVVIRSSPLENVKLGFSVVHGLSASVAIACVQ